MINFETENLIIVCYPSNAGGKFLINCLGLSDNAVLQDKNLAIRQLDNKFNQQDKIQFIKTQLSAVNKEWNDLNLGCIQLFGVDGKCFSKLNVEEIRKNLNKEIDKISNSGKKFFLVIHYDDLIESVSKLWPNAKIIYFKNYENFMIFRGSIYNVWNRFAGVDWPKYPPKNLKEFEELPDFIKQELINMKIFLTHEHTKKFNHCHIWDTNNYFSEDDTVAGIKDLYSQLNLNNFNELAIREYYNLWIDKLRELSIK